MFGPDGGLAIVGHNIERESRNRPNSHLDIADKNTPAPLPFASFERAVVLQSALRAATTAAYRVPEPECVPKLIEQARLPPPVADAAQSLARKLVATLRAAGSRGGVEALIQEFSLSSQEGVALMCLAEALLRIPDTATRDALIRDKIGGGDWASHASNAPSLFVNAATWGLMITGKLVSTSSEVSMASALTRLIAKGGEPLIRKGVDLGMRLMGEQFVSGETIERALANGRKREARGFRHSYDMLGEAAATAEDAQRYYVAYEHAIHAIGTAASGRGIYDGPGISIKLSALHPRYSRAQRTRVLAELGPRVRALTLLARQYDIGINIDAEEADRLDLSLDLLESLCFDGALEAWNGIGFVVQAYQKRAPFVLDYLIALAARSRHRLMVRLVKGAYWDTEIKRAQVDGLAGYPVYTRKIYTDVSYLACARKLLTAEDAIYPQFATHNALTLASIYHLAGTTYEPGQYEFQCLHGMGEPLYDQVVGPLSQGKLDRPCRIYAPVGTHETLLAYLVRRLLENGANTSFVNRIADPAVDIGELIEDPVIQAERVVPLGAPHPKIALPSELYAPVRTNSSGLDLSNETTLASLSKILRDSAGHAWAAAPGVAEGASSNRAPRDVLNPANQQDHVGKLVESVPSDVSAALERAVGAAPRWRGTAVGERAACLDRAASLLEERMQLLMGLVIRESGKSVPDAIAEVREAVDFLRYYAAEVRRDFDNATHTPLGPVVCISPWNFPLAIFLGQVGAALAAGNPVLAKPAEQTPLIAAEAVRLLHQGGVPEDVVQLLPGRGETVGAALVGDSRTRGVLFTGSTDVARVIARALALRIGSEGDSVYPIPLIAETGGQNAMIVDSSALPEQVVQDALHSAFDSAGQRCSALRVLCLQEDIAPGMLHMLKGAMGELVTGNPDRLATDVGPVIDREAHDAIERHIEAMRARGHEVYRLPLPSDVAAEAFVSPTLIELDSIKALKREVFGPVLHVVRYRRDGLDALLDDIRATGYGLTFGVHSRIDETIDRVIDGVRAGNIYVNRNIIGAVVGVQPFGGEGLSGTGPKAGGPLYVRRLLAGCSPRRKTGDRVLLERVSPLIALRDWLTEAGDALAARICAHYADASPLHGPEVLPGPTGEQNTYELRPRGRVLCRAQTRLGALTQLGATLATGNTACFAKSDVTSALPGALPASVGARMCLVADLSGDSPATNGDHFTAALFEGEPLAAASWARQLAARDGPIVTPQCLTPADIADGMYYSLDWLVAERSISINTAAAGGNASLMTIG
jgi:RHH-type proline utilization regulon transcriptional repressor/proline dehydrogenase/delta 1-pyrroline-5-carboxylate dehydrogenase